MAKYSNVQDNFRNFSTVQLKFTKGNNLKFQKAKNKNDKNKGDRLYFIQGSVLPVTSFFLVPEVVKKKALVALALVVYLW